MTTGSLKESTGLTIITYKPDIDVSTPSYVPNSILVDNDLAEKVSSYNHTISAMGGYDKASFSIAYNITNAEDWINRLGYHVEVYNPELEKVWEGFVNQITLSIGGLTATRGPLTDIGNSVFIVYSTFDGSTVPPTLGMRESSAIATNSESQDFYGLIQKAISIGGASQSSAEQIRDTWLAENAYPETGQSFRSQASVDTRVQIDCLGYYHWLDLFIFNSTVSGTREISAAIKDVFNYEQSFVNGMYSTDLSNIVTPGSPVSIKRYINENNKAKNRIKYLTAFGDGADTRYLFGIYNDLVPYYDAIPSEIEYIQRLSDPIQKVRTVSGQTIEPWDVRPGKWLEYTDFLVGASVPSNFRENPRIEFIESVTYTAPFSLVHNGNKVGTFKQRLAKFGLTGVGV